MKTKCLLNLFRCLWGKKKTVIMPVHYFDVWPSSILVMSVLHRLDCTDPRKRSLNVYDRKFLKLVPHLHKYSFALSFLNRYGHVCDTYFEALKDADKNAYLQMCLCDVERFKFSDRYYARYSNLVCCYLKRWDFLPEVKAKIFKDDKYHHVIDIYRLFRKE